MKYSFEIRPMGGFVLSSRCYTVDQTRSAHVLVGDQVRRVLVRLTSTHPHGFLRGDFILHSSSGKKKKKEIRPICAGMARVNSKHVVVVFIVRACPSSPLDHFLGCFQNDTPPPPSLLFLPWCCVAKDTATTRSLRSPPVSKDNH